ncbi:aminotransferase class I/II-fold pyridoxal phosphate-dependent enzyme [Candidatus Parcubacteria bacterium]|nr:aminotransferase class I/II-fold pyridoxal phosphate-dependent enzyme [Candidatus Parcubacteria bacterium]
MESLLKPAAGNLFQVIKAICSKAREAGKKLRLLSIGQPSGPAPFPARQAKSAAAMSPDQAMHEYQDNDTPGCPDFAKRFVWAHPGNREVLEDVKHENIAYLPIPGIKPMIAYIIESLGGWEDGESSDRVVMTTPGYPTPMVQSIMAAGVEHRQFDSFSADCGFLPTIEDIVSNILVRGDLLMLNLPNNPTGAVATAEWYHKICTCCEENEIRIFNDAAYAVLKSDPSVPNLAQIAPLYPNLSWCEAYSASKAGNMCGWRVGAMVGSADFIGDISRIKGESDSGLDAASAFGVIDLFENHFDVIERIRDGYAESRNKLIEIATDCGLELALEPKAGFFVMFHVPDTAFGQKVESAEHFNQLMIENTGVVGVPFKRVVKGEDREYYIRYAVCTENIHEIEDELRSAFTKIGIQNTASV